MTIIQTPIVEVKDLKLNADESVAKCNQRDLCYATYE